VATAATASAPTTTHSSERFASLAKPQDFFSPKPDNAPGPFFPPPPTRLSQKQKDAFRSVPGSSPIADVLDALVYPTHATAVAPESDLAYDKSAETDKDASRVVFVDTEAGLIDVATDLKSDAVTAFAVDLEHHSYRSFKGFTCLVQISTPMRDYVIDVLNPAVRADFKNRLGALFEDPGKVKILHGADYDVKWLQRDFGVYVVNMFDTGQAARVLQFPKKSLAYLLKHFVGVDAEKQYQLADWRTRPLSNAMLDYAAGDTKHLLYVYDVLKRRLRDASEEGTDLVTETFKRSAQICKYVYESPSYDKNNSWRDEYFSKVPANERDLTPKQLAAFAAAHAWRDATARDADESPGYVTSRALLLRIARALPETERALLAITRGEAPALVQRASSFLDVVLRAAASGAPPLAEVGDQSGKKRGPEHAGANAQEEAAAGEGTGGARDTVSRDGNASSVPSDTLSLKRKHPSAPPADFAAPARASAMAAMMGDAFPSETKRNGAVFVSSPRSAMARFLSSDGSSLPSDAPSPATGTAIGSTKEPPSNEDVSAARAAARVRESLAKRAVPLAEVFGFSATNADGFAEQNAPAATGRHARAHKNETVVDASGASDHPTSKNARPVIDDPAPGKSGTQKGPEGVTLPGGSLAPAPLRRDPHSEKRRAAAEAAEAEAATKARAAAARDELARRRGAFAKSHLDPEDSDSDSDSDGDVREGGKNKTKHGVDPEDEAALFAGGGRRRRLRLRGGGGGGAAERGILRRARRAGRGAAGGQGRERRRRRRGGRRRAFRQEPEQEAPEVGQVRRRRAHDHGAAVQAGEKVQGVPAFGGEKRDVLVMMNEALRLWKDMNTMVVSLIRIDTIASIGSSPSPARRRSRATLSLLPCSPDPTPRFCAGTVRSA
jgi:exosome complex exonuclease RRP6